MLHIVLYCPEIPQNTGNIARTCASTGAVLHLIRPMGFTVDDKKLKRAGLDYWHKLDIRYHDGYEGFLSDESPQRVYAVTTQGDRRYTDIDYQYGDYLLFGQETAGLPPEIRDSLPGLRIPMRPENRSLNLSNTAALVLYEAFRQLGFPGLV